MKQRLTDILRHEADPPVPESALDAIYQRCRSTKQPLGEALVSSGLVTEGGLRRALRQHNAESLALISMGGVTLEGARWSERKARYDARFTFGPAELLVALCALHQTQLAGQARQWLLQVLGGGGLGIAYTRCIDCSVALPLAQVGAEHLSIGDFIDMGERAERAMTVANQLAGGTTFATTGPDGSSFVAWQQKDLLYALLCQSRGAMARVLGRIERDLESVRPGEV
jgi:hypothetical protein